MRGALGYGWVLLVGLVSILSSCKDQTNQIGNEKKLQNDEEIKAYLAAKGIPAQRTPEGIYYQVVSKNSGGQKAAIGDEIKITYIARRLDDVVVDSSELSTNKPVRAIYSILRLPYLSDQAMALVFGTPLLAEGDSAVLFVPSHLGQGATGTLLFPAYSPVRLDLKVVSISTEAEQLDAYIRKKGVFVTETTESGLRFGKTLSRTDSAQVKDGDVLQVKYTGRLLDDTVFESSTRTETIGSGNSVKGFSEGLLKMRIGEKANLLFPSSLGYGVQGSGAKIPAYSPLYFEVEILSKKK